MYSALASQEFGFAVELKLSLSFDAGILYSFRGSITLFVIDHSSEHNVLRCNILVVVCLLIVK